MADPPSYPGAPRWLRVFGITIGIVVLLLVVLVHWDGGARHTMPFVGSIDHSAAHATHENGR